MHNQLRNKIKYRKWNCILGLCATAIAVAPLRGYALVTQFDYK